MVSILKEIKTLGHTLAFPLVFQAWLLFSVIQYTLKILPKIFKLIWIFHRVIATKEKLKS